MRADVAQYFSRRIVWRKTGDGEFPYMAAGEHGLMKIRINDFPAEPLYSLIADDVVLCDFDQWPPNWQKGKR
ncbi:MAG: hypothetical protein SD837_13660 [Candidatus Electrothrix scaldis]|nr:MAG: hypothetical protein SD837_13660 [Candidatus Electrothrix sp. GW3-3]